MPKFEIDYIIKIAYECEAENAQEAYDQMSRMPYEELVENSNVYDSYTDGIYEKIKENGVTVGEKEVSDDIEEW